MVSSIFNLWTPQGAFNLLPIIAGVCGAYASWFIVITTGNAFLSFFAALAVSIGLSIAGQILLISPLLRRNQASRSVLLASLGLLGVAQAVLTLLAD